MAKNCKTCPYCGDNLDYGEMCSCVKKEMVQNEKIDCTFTTKLTQLKVEIVADVSFDSK